ncbi:bis(5'-nucleosyl)-tetraphosphatase (symmetrical) YqeK [Anaerocolumna sp.]|uniref:bis(5'-nucleosyl)-tetraphosphatase (symmetrical) YqeK n=1 Tax=Anaerocolumna sp. TaxID=2041569 RepID=UPI0028ABC620|nr:bis(5'-nucleosyl)-tetraphosphatase (symmetrical) YqeK [Anaerocolumna sp.]
MQYDLFGLQQAMAKVQTEKRFYHTLGVQTTSFAMALKHGADEEKALIAGLLHDSAKCLSGAVLLSECHKYGLSISDAEEKSPYLLHGKLGAYYAEFKYGIEDKEIQSAISYHTTGKPDMSLLEKIVFTADYIEPNRSSERIPNLHEIRILAFENLDLAVYQILESTLNYLKKIRLEIDSTTVEAYEYYKSIIR